MSRLSPWLLGLVISASANAAQNGFDCLRELIQVTDRSSFLIKRKDVERPFIVDNSYIVFPEVDQRKVTGFFFYGSKGAWYYDAVQIKGKGRQAIEDLTFVSEIGIYELVAQPTGLETVAVYLLPGFNSIGSKGNGAAVLGASVLPVVGAFVSRPERRQMAYDNPTTVPELSVKQWMMNQLVRFRRPASVNDVEINRTIAHLSTRRQKPTTALWAPMVEELKQRKRWIQTRNLDDQTYQEFSRILDRGLCRE